MSIIVAYKHKGVVYMGADTQITSGCDKINAVSECNYKISKLSNGILLGCTGSVVTHQILISNEEIFTLTTSKRLTKKHIVCEILPKLLEVLGKEEKLEFDKEKNKVEMDVSLILSYKDTIFKIYDNFKVTKHNKFQIIGSGIDVALYSVNNIDESKNIEDELVKTMKISSKYLTNVGGPYILINTKDLQFKGKE